jgi:hypothetical protein
MQGMKGSFGLREFGDYIERFGSRQLLLDFIIVIQGRNNNGMSTWEIF